jgi:EREBP-like factor
VYWDSSRQKFKAEIGNRDRGTRKRLGSFSTAEAAAEAYDIAAVELYGSEAVLNFPLAGYTTVTVVQGCPIHCASGHRMDDANTYIDPIGRRACRRCTADSANRYYYRKKQRILE